LATVTGIAVKCLHRSRRDAWRAALSIDTIIVLDDVNVFELFDFAWAAAAVEHLG
jgi:hypothetical protein